MQIANNKAPGTQEININLAKCASSMLHARLLKVINTGWKKGYAVEDWKPAVVRVIPIFKKRDSRGMQYYGRTCLLNARCEMFAKISNEGVVTLAETSSRASRMWSYIRRILR
jgi:hypothetical protein